MKLMGLFVMLMAVLALFAGAGDAAPRPDPKVDWKALAKTGKTLKKIVSAAGAVFTAREIYQSTKNRNNGQQG